MHTHTCTHTRTHTHTSAQPKSLTFRITAGQYTNILTADLLAARLERADQISLLPIISGKLHKQKQDLEHGTEQV